MRDCLAVMVAILSAVYAAGRRDGEILRDNADDSIDGGEKD